INNYYDKAMKHTFDIVDIEPVILAITETRLTPSEVSSRIIGLFDIVYKWLRTSNVKQIGHNYAIYDQCTNENMRMRVGVPVSKSFPDSELVKCVELEAGRAAHVKHIGPYSELQTAYAGLTAWCSQETHKTSGQSWEVYGDWNDDPSKLVTDIYFRIIC